MDKIGEKFASLSDADRAEDEYYKSLTPNERVDILLQLIAQYGHLFDGTSEGFVRVFKLTSLEES
jgi:hypothetical protein